MIAKELRQARIPAKLQGNTTLFIVSLLIYFASSQSAAYANVYAATLFLKYYPAAWYSFYYIAIVPLNLLVSYYVTPWINRKSYVASVVLILVMLVLLWVNSLFFFWRWAPFIFILVLTIFNILLFVVCTCAVAATFNTYQYKAIVSKLLFVGTIGSICAYFISGFLAKKFFLDTVLYALMVSSLFAILIVMGLKPLYKTENSITVKTNISKTPLVQSILLISMLASLLACLVKYFINYHVALSFDSIQTAQFFAVLFGSQNILILMLQLFGMQPLLRGFGIAGLFYVTPILSLVALLLYLYQPSLISVVILNVVFYVQFDSYLRTAVTISINALTSAIRKIVTMYAYGIVTYMGKLIAAVFMMLLAETSLLSADNSLRVLCLLCVIGAVIWLFAAHKVTRHYQATLVAGINNQRFDFTSDLMLHANDLIKNQIAYELLKEANVAQILLGFSWLNDFSSPKLTLILQDKLHFPNEEIQLAAVKVIRKSKRKELIADLQQLLTQTTNIVLLREILFAIFEFNAEQGLIIANNWLNTNDSNKQLCAALLQLASVRSDLYQSASAIIYSSLQDPNNEVRKSTLNYLANIEFVLPHAVLLKLLADSDLGVVAECLRYIRYKNLAEFIPDVVQTLAQPVISYYAIKTLRSFGDKVLSLIVPRIKAINPKTIIVSSKVLAGINSKLASEQIIELAQIDNDFVTTTLAEVCLTWVSKMRRDRAFYTAVYHLILSSAAKMQSLQAILLAIDNSQFSQLSALQTCPLYLYNELQVRQKLAQQRCLYWFAIYTDRLEAVKEIPIILKPAEDGSISSGRRYQAIELFDSLATDDKLRSVIQLFLGKSVTSLLLSDAEIAKSFDVTVQQLISYASKNMDNIIDANIKKFMVLRQTALFSELAAEVLYALAEVANWREVSKGELLFSYGDLSDCLYIIAAGAVAIKRGENIISLLKTNAYFGEVGLLDNSVRTADAIVEEDGMLLYIDKNTFENIVVDLPQVLRVLVQKIISYYRTTIDHNV